MIKLKSAGDRTATEDGGFEALVEVASARLQAGEPVDPDVLAADHPQHAERLRKLLPTLQAMADLGHSLTEPSAAPGADERAEPVGGTLGDFRILQEIGRGGMGVVYEAEQISLKRRVALKVLPFAAVLDQKQLQRFKNEAQAAALLHHQNIVPIYSVGCERGVHYYAMQFIEGQTLGELIGQLRQNSGLEPKDEQASAETATAPSPPTPRPDATTLTLPELVTTASTTRPAFFRSVAQLGIQVAEALDHAHQQGVVHRDIKPSNLMVDAGGKPWIADFGLARIEAGPNLTVSGDVLGTLRYMSPEQAMAKRGVVDHRTDIYSLGVTLYELLTLRPAFGGTTRQELLRQITLEEPRAPRKLNKAIPADLETVLLKAMAKEPAERYATAQELADDLERLLEDKPIQARRPGPWVRLGKWTKRHKALTGAAVIVVFLAAVAAGGMKVWRDRQLRGVAVSVGESLAGARAAIEAEDYALARQKLAHAQGRIAEARGALSSLAAHIQQLKDELERFQEFLRLADEAHYCIGGQPKLIEFAGQALSLYGVMDRAEWAAELEGRPLHPDQRRQIRRTAYEMLLLLADYRIRWWNRPEKVGQTTRESAARQGLLELEKATTFHPPTRAFYHVRGKCRRGLGDTKGAEADAKRAEWTEATIALDWFIPGRDAAWKGDKEEAVKQFRAALRLEPDHYWSLLLMGNYLGDLGRYGEAVVAFTGCAGMRPQHASAYSNRGVALARLGQHEEALADSFKAIKLKPKEPQFYGARGETYRRLGQLDEAVSDFSKALELDPKSPQLYAKLGLTYRQLGRLGEAEKAFRQGLAAAQDLTAESPSDPKHREGVAGTRNNLGMVLDDTGRFQEAEQEYRQAASLFAKLVSDCPTRPHYRCSLAGTYYSLGMLLNATGRPQEAEREYRQAISLLAKLASDFPAKADYRQRLATAQNNLGNLLEHVGRLQEAEEALRKALALRQKLVAEFPTRADYRSELAGSHLSLGGLVKETARYREAEQAYRQALELFATLAEEFPNTPQYRKDLATVYNSLGVLLKDIGRHEEALRCYQRALASREELVTEFPSDHRYRGDVARTHLNLGVLHRRLRQLPEAEQAYRKAIAMREKLVRQFPDVAQYQEGLAKAQHNLANVLFDAQRHKEAEAAYRRAIALEEKLVEASPSVPDYRMYLSGSLSTLGGLLKNTGRLEEAEEAYRKALGLLKDLAHDFPERSLYRRDLARSHLGLASLLNEAGHPAEAAQHYREVLKLNPQSATTRNSLAWLLATCPDPQFRDPAQAVELARKAVEVAPQTGTYWGTLGAAHYRARDWKAAIEALDKSMELRSGGDSFNFFFLAMAHWQLGHKDQARKWYNQAVEWMDKNKPEDEQLRRFRAEAEELIRPREKHHRDKEGTEKE